MDIRELIDIIILVVFFPILGIDISEYFTHEYINIDTSNQNVILIENGAVLKVYYLNKDTLESLHQ